MATKLALGRFAVGAQLVGGAEASVYSAHDERDGCEVVLKCVALGATASRLRLLAEFEHLAQLACPQLPTVKAFGEVGPGEPIASGTVVLATERIVGVDARTACVAAERPANEVATVLADAARALAVLHGASLVHHDVKPDHLLRDERGGYRLIDLGLTQPLGPADGRVRGTLPYLSADALVGAGDPRVDLYALGVTGYELLAGRLPYDAATAAELLAAHGGPRRPLRGPAALIALIDTLLDRTPSDATLIVDELVRAELVAESTPTRRLAANSGFVGRDKVLAALDADLDRTHLVALVGEPGSGRTRLVEELHHRRLIARLRGGVGPAHLLGTTIDAAATSLAVSTEQREGLIARVLDAVREPTLLHLDHPDERTIASVRDALRLAPNAQLQIVLELHSTHPGIPTVALPPLDVEELALLCERVAGVGARALAPTLASLSEGRARWALALLREAGADPTEDTLRGVSLRDLTARTIARIAALPELERQLVLALALLERSAIAAEIGVLAPEQAIARAIAHLEAQRLVEWRGDRLALVDTSSAAAIVARAPKVERSHVGALLLQALSDAFAAAFVAQRIDDPSARSRAVHALDDLIADHSKVSPPLAQQLSLATITDAPERYAGELLFAAGRYAEARARLERAGDDPRAQLLLARTLRALGDVHAARRVLSLLTKPVNEVGNGARVVMARLELDAGHADGARALLTGSAPTTSWARAERHEVLGLAALREGSVHEARKELEALRAQLVDAGPRRLARVEALLGMVAQAEGALDVAADSYRAALVLAESAGDAHGAAVYAQNLGATLYERGELAQALPVLDRAVDVLGRLGRSTEQALALFNLGNLQRSLGDLEAARRAVDAARAIGGDEARWAELLAADLDRQAERGDDALARYDALERQALAPTELLYVHAARAETLAEMGRLADAAPLLPRLLDDDMLREVTPAARRHALLSAARVQLATAPDEALPADVVAALATELGAATNSGARDRALRAEILLLRNSLRRGDENQARARLEAARVLYEEILMRTPELRRASLAEDPDLRRLVALLHIAPTSAAADSRLRRLLEINKRLNSELDLDRLLELILDTVIELSRAERGFLLLRGDDGALEVRMERNVDSNVREGVAAFSRSIAERAALEGQPIVTVDAADDARFERALSIVDLHLRSVLAVPLAVKGRGVGCVYVDHRARVGLFRPEDVSLVSDLAEQAAIAVENARLLADNRDKEERVRALNTALEARLQTQSVELEGMHREVREARRTLGLRYDYGGLIGQTPRMVELFRLLDRVTETALPVVIYGESGTGKELVARAIHHNGPRRKAAFVSESCAAIPETLLEAALFGHVRGAFTGAQGERRGLFEIADGGTLFLDEVGEMSAGMQVRLLRVLQEGEFRRVGGEKLMKVDVRVLVASNRDLGRLVEEGRFREDLFYRLNVVRVALPPLRERQADVPLLVEHFLSRRPGNKGITRRALERLTRYRWPGNVRQLENELARASSLAEAPIDIADLSPQVASGMDEADVSGPDPLDLHERVERLERSLLEEALRRSAGNQSHAARLLGLSRFGMQKKLTRYGLR